MPFYFKDIMITNTSANTYYGQILKDLENKKTWHSDLQFNLNDSLNTDQEFVNISNIIKSRNNFSFPSHFNSTENK